MDALGVAVMARKSDPLPVPVMGVRPPPRAGWHVPWLQMKHSFGEHPLPIPVLWSKSPKQPFVLLQTASTAPMEAPLASAGVAGADVKSVKANGARARIAARRQDAVRDRVVIIFSCGVPEYRRVRVAPNLASPSMLEVATAVLALCGQRLGGLRIALLVRLRNSPDGRDMRMEADVPDTPRLWRFSTEMLPQRDRFSAFREGLARQVLIMDVVDHSGGRPRFDISYMALGQVAACALVATPGELIRDKRHIKDGTDDFFLTIVEAGPIHVWHAGEEGSQSSGSAYLSNNASPIRFVGAHGSAVRNVTVSTRALSAMVRHPEALVGQFVRPGPALRLLDGYLRSLSALEEAPPPELAHTIGQHLLDLTAAALGPTADASEIIAERGLKAARVSAIMSSIARHFSDPNLDLDRLAGHLGLSRRYVQRLLNETGKSFTEHVTERRLQRAHAMLTDPRFGYLRIIDIALAAGFNDISHFNRMFRRRFGDTPTGVRVAAGRER
jgi:AraC-like DNA-binding protein